VAGSAAARGGDNEHSEDTLNEYRLLSITQLRRVCALAIVVCGLLAASTPAFAQSDKWEVDIAPLYLWGATTSGNIAINGNKNIPVYLDFANAASNLAAAFSFHGEARRGQWGFIGDINFLRLSTDVSYTIPLINAPIAGTLAMDQTIFNGKVSYEVKRGSRFLVVGGVRTLTMSPTAHFTGPVGGQLADLNGSKTDVAAVVGFNFRPKLGQKVVLLTQADIGGGSAFTYSALGGVEFQIKPWIGLAAGYNVLHIDTGNVPTSGSGPVNELQYSVTQYGPVVTLAFHWSQK
jgi:opacity protein-like surface antigen